MSRKIEKKRIDDPDEIARIARNAFKVHFSEVKLVRVNVNPRLDYNEKPIVEVKIIYDGKLKQMNGDGLLRVQHDIVSKAWRDVEKDLGFPIVQFFAKSDLGRRDPATV